MKNTFYFAHDYNARNDDKIVKLIFKHGWKGYGLYWAIAEKLYEAGGELEKKYALIAFDLKDNKKIIKSIVEDFNLFLLNKTKFSAKRIEEHIAFRKERSESGSKGAQIRWQEHSSAMAEPSSSQCHRIEKNRIEENRIEKSIDVSGKPDLTQPILYLNEKTKSNFSIKNKSSLSLIKARINEGRTLKDFECVIDKKAAAWLTDEKMMMYLRPKTLFSATNFESYLNEPINQSKEKQNLRASFGLEKD